MRRVTSGRHGPLRRGHERPPVYQITGARRGVRDDVDSRTRRYLISMGIRTLCFILAVVFMGHWVMWLFLAGSFFLPTIAVVIANAGVTPDPGGSEFDYNPDLRALDGGPVAPPRET